MSQCVKRFYVLSIRYLGLVSSCHDDSNDIFNSDKEINKGIFFIDSFSWSSGIVLMPRY